MEVSDVKVYKKYNQTYFETSRVTLIASKIDCWGHRDISYIDENGKKVLMTPSCKITNEQLKEEIVKI
jgi:hypothetical protein